LNLAAINAEKNIFELSNPNSHVVHKGKFHNKKTKSPAKVASPKEIKTSTFRLSTLYNAAGGTMR
jgi:hypothetical protein